MREEKNRLVQKKKQIAGSLKDKGETCGEKWDKATLKRDGVFL